MEEAAFLMAMQGVIGRIEIENDLFGRRSMCLEEEVDAQAFDGRRIMIDLCDSDLFPQARALAGSRCSYRQAARSAGR
jgi:hypothetical protein